MRSDRYVWVKATVLNVGFVLMNLGCGDDSSSTPAAGGSSGSAGGPGASPWASELRIGTGRCLTVPVSVGVPGSADDGRTSCEVVEVTAARCDCGAPGRAPIAAESMALVRTELATNGLCGTDIGIECASYCGCEIMQLMGTAADTTSGLYACQNEVMLRDNALVGFCVLDAERTRATGEPAPLGSPQLLADCPENARRRVRFVGSDTPAEGKLVFLVCR